MNAVPEEIGRDDIERKFRELQTDVVGTVGAEVRVLCASPLARCCPSRS